MFSLFVNSEIKEVLTKLKDTDNWSSNNLVFDNFSSIITYKSGFSIFVYCGLDNSVWSPDFYNLSFIETFLINRNIKKVFKVIASKTPKLRPSRPTRVTREEFTIPRNLHEKN